MSDDERGRGRPKRTYIYNDGSFALPLNKDILRDFKSCGGSFKKFLDSQCATEDHRMILACDVLEQIGKVEDDQIKWESIRILSEQAEALLARDVLIKIAKTEGTGQIQALKLVRDFSKDHVGKVKEPIDNHLRQVEEDETQS